MKLVWLTFSFCLMCLGSFGCNLDSTSSGSNHSHQITVNELLENEDRYDGQNVEVTGFMVALDQNCYGLFNEYESVQVPTIGNVIRVCEFSPFVQEYVVVDGVYQKRTKELKQIKSVTYVAEAIKGKEGILMFREVDQQSTEAVEFRKNLRDQNIIK